VIRTKLARADYDNLSWSEIGSKESLDLPVPRCFALKRNVKRHIVNARIRDAMSQAGIEAVFASVYAHRPFSRRLDAEQGVASAESTTNFSVDEPA
jgi:hypothetical protein